MNIPRGTTPTFTLSFPADAGIDADDSFADGDWDSDRPPAADSDPPLHKKPEQFSFE